MHYLRVKTGGNPKIARFFQWRRIYFFPRPIHEKHGFFAYRGVRPGYADHFFFFEMLASTKSFSAPDEKIVRFLGCTLFFFTRK